MVNKTLSQETVKIAIDALQCQLTACKQDLDELEKSNKPFHEVGPKARAVIAVQLRVTRALDELKAL